MKTASINRGYLQQHNLRFEGEHYLNDNAYLSMHMETHCDKCKHLDELALVFNPPVFKRQFCNKTPRSVQYFQSSDVNNASEESSVHIFKGQAESLNLLVKHNDILVTGFGSIGNTRLVSILQDGVCYANNVCRVRTNAGIKAGYLYACMSSKYSTAQLNNNASGSVVRYIEAPGIKKTLIPNFPESFQQQVDVLIQESAKLREEATALLSDAQKKLKEYASLKDLDTSDYDFYGPSVKGREPSTFVLSRKSINTTSINAFNYSERIRKTKLLVRNSVPLKEVLLDGDTFSTGSFPRVEVNSANGIMLINQSDIFDTIIKGKYISRRNVKTHNLVEYGEVLVAGVGTLGESETFCRAIYANEDLVGQLVSGEFIRMKVNSTIPSGYLFAWLNSDYGFRFIRNTQAGTKLCRPIPALFLEIPIPILCAEQMKEIDQLVTKAHTLKYKANCNERAAISMVEQEIEKWNN